MHHIGWHNVRTYDEYLKVTRMLEENGFPCLQSFKIFVSRLSFFDTTKVLGTILEVAYRDPDRKRPDPLYIYPKPE
jgi:hypothetical protein